MAIFHQLLNLVLLYSMCSHRLRLLQATSPPRAEPRDSVLLYIGWCRELTLASLFSTVSDKCSAANSFFFRGHVEKSARVKFHLRPRDNAAHYAMIQTGCIHFRHLSRLTRNSIVAKRSGGSAKNALPSVCLFRCSIATRRYTYGLRL